jgi:hypothetical protein
MTYDFHWYEKPFVFLRGKQWLIQPKNFKVIRYPICLKREKLISKHGFNNAFINSILLCIHNAKTYLLRADLENKIFPGQKQETWN